MSKHPHFAIRTVRKGLVRVGGRTFHVTPHKDWPNLDMSPIEGKRFAFGRYWEGDDCLPILCLWGTEEEFRYREDDWAEKDFVRPHVIDGTLVYAWWETVR